VFFENQTVDSLIEGLDSLDQIKWNSLNIRKHAEEFSEEVFINKLTELIDNLMEKKERTYKARVSFRRLG
jgi:hypothetical protein